MELALLKKVAKQLRYRPLPEFIGRQVLIRSIETIPADIRDDLNCDWFTDYKFLRNHSNLEGTLAYYGFLDLAFSARLHLLKSQYRSGISLLKELRFILDPSEVEERDNDFDDLFKDDPTCLRNLANELAEQKTYIRLFLKSSYPNPDFTQRLSRIPSGYLPRFFMIEDACVTNAKFVWFHKHFYC